MRLGDRPRWDATTHRGRSSRPPGSTSGRTNAPLPLASSVVSVVSVGTPSTNGVDDALRVWRARQLSTMSSTNTGWSKCDTNRCCVCRIMPVGRGRHCRAGALERRRPRVPDRATERARAPSPGRRPRCRCRLRGVAADRAADWLPARSISLHSGRVTRLRGHADGIAQLVPRSRSWLEPSLVECGAHASMHAMECRGDRAATDAERRGDRGLVEVGEVAKEHDLALSRRQAGDERPGALRPRIRSRPRTPPPPSRRADRSRCRSEPACVPRSGRSATPTPRGHRASGATRGERARVRTRHARRPERRRRRYPLQRRRTSTARAAYSRARSSRVARRAPTESNARAGDSSASCTPYRPDQPAEMFTRTRADEGTRTLDLRHGKATL